MSKTARPYKVLLERGDCHASLGDLAAAQGCYEKAASLGPDEAGPYVGFGAIALQKNQIDDAEIAFRVACRLDPDSAKAHAGLAIIAQRRRDFPRALDLYMKSLELDGDNLAALLGLFQTSCQMGSFEGVSHYLRVYLDMHPGDVPVMFALATLYARDGRRESAREMLVSLLTLDPDNRDAANLLEEVEHQTAGIR
jgi:tetratricopeptide (TPR) repeat protein